MPTNTSQRQIIPTNTRSINDRLFQLIQDLSTADIVIRLTQVNDRLRQLTQVNDRLFQLTKVNDRLFQLTPDLSTADYSN